AGILGARPTRLSPDRPARHLTSAPPPIPPSAAGMPGQRSLPLGDRAAQHEFEALVRREYTRQEEEEPPRQEEEEEPSRQAALDDSAWENPETGERGGPRGREPVRYGDWERGGRCIDF